MQVFLFLLRFYLSCCVLGDCITPKFCNKAHLPPPHHFFFFPKNLTSHICKENPAPDLGSFFPMHLIQLFEAHGSSAFPRKAGSSPRASPQQDLLAG